MIFTELNGCYRGTIDWEALKSGNYVLYALTADDNGNIIDDPNIHVEIHFTLIMCKWTDFPVV